MSFKINYKVHILCFVFAYFLSVLISSKINIMMDAWISSKFFFYPTEFLLINYLLYLSILMVPVTIVHELIHGLTFNCFGYPVTYGFKGIYAYTKETSGRPISRNEFIIILLTPVLIISAFSLLIGSGLFTTIFVLNFLGSTGDFIMVLFLLKCESKRKVIDKEYGFDVV